MISAVAFAGALGLDSSRLASYEQGRVPLRYWVVRRLCDKFKVSPTWLATGLGEMEVKLPLPDPHSIGAKDADPFSAVFGAKLLPALQVRECDDFHQMANSLGSLAAPGMRLWCVDELTKQLQEWFRVVPDADVGKLKQQIEASAGELLKGSAPDAWEVEARRRTDMQQIEQVSVESMRPFVDVERSGLLLELVSAELRGQMHGNYPRKEAAWTLLVLHLVRLLKDVQNRSELVERLGVSDGRLSDWISQREKPDHESALALLTWIAVKEIAQRNAEEEASFTPGEKIEKYLTNKSEQSTVQPMPTWAQLKAEVQRLTGERGEKAALARYCQVTPQAVATWLDKDSATEPGAEATLKLLEFVEERKRTAAPAQPTAKKPRKAKR